MHLGARGRWRVGRTKESLGSVGGPAPYSDWSVGGRSRRPRASDGRGGRNATSAGFGHGRRRYRVQRSLALVAGFRGTLEQSDPILDTGREQMIDIEDPIVSKRSEGISFGSTGASQGVDLATMATES
jgi:hypothetical protein